MAYLTVTTQADVVEAGDGKLSLREAVAQANGSASANTIRFTAALEGKTLVLTGGELVIERDLTIDGAGRDITLSGGGQNRIVNVAPGSGLHLEQLTLTAGQSPVGQSGGAVFAGNGSRVFINNNAIVANKAYLNGGAIATGTDATLVIRGSLIKSNLSSINPSRVVGGGGVFMDKSASLLLEDSVLMNNSHVYRGNLLFTQGGALRMSGGVAIISRCTIVSNDADLGGGISADDTAITVANSTISENTAELIPYGGRGGGIDSSGALLAIRNCTITGNRATGACCAGGGEDYVSSGGGIAAWPVLEITNSIVSGNRVAADERGRATSPDIYLWTTGKMRSNGHNVFGSNVAGNIAGDREKVAPANLFAAIDPNTGGGKLSPTGIVPLKNASPTRPSPPPTRSPPAASASSAPPAPAARRQPARHRLRSRSTSRSRPAPPSTTTC